MRLRSPEGPEFVGRSKAVGLRGGIIQSTLYLAIGTTIRRAGAIISLGFLVYCIQFRLRVSRDTIGDKEMYRRRESVQP